MKKSGISRVLVVVIIVAFLVVGFAGYNIYKSDGDEGVVTEDSLMVEEYPVESSQDVQAMEDELNLTDLGQELDTTELEADLQEIQ